MSIRAAAVLAHGEPPAVQERPAPEARDGQVLVEVHAAPITPLDVLCASGTSYFGPPPLPYVPGVQGVGVVAGGSPLAAGTRVWFSTSAGMAPGDGSMSSRVAVPCSDVVTLEHEVGATAVAALGLSAIAAWMGLTWRGGLTAGEQVVVLGAGGAVGQAAVQIARLHEARRVVGACRSDDAAERALRAGADDVVRLDTEDVDELARRFTGACDGAADLVLDPLFGAPAAAALRALGPGGRLVNLGGSASPTAPIDSATLRSRSLRVLGYTNNELSAEQRRDALREVVRHAAAGELRVEHEVVPLDRVAEAWSRQQRGRARARLVVDLT